jgi:pimeloyl-ACP methyl ester carboxylesterase
VTGGLDDGSENAPLAAELAEHFTVFNYARRGRGDSGDTQPYAVEREIEDIEALIAEAGGSAHQYGVSSGGALALEAAAAGLAVDKIAVYEVPYNVADEWPQRSREYVEKLDELLAEGRRGDAVELFMRLADSSGGASDDQGPDAHGRPEGARRGARTVLRRMTSRRGQAVNARRELALELR